MKVMNIELYNTWINVSSRKKEKTEKKIFKKNQMNYDMFASEYINISNFLILQLKFNLSTILSVFLSKFDPRVNNN